MIRAKAEDFEVWRWSAMGTKKLLLLHFPSHSTFNSFNNFTRASIFPQITSCQNLHQQITNKCFHPFQGLNEGSPSTIDDWRDELEY